MQNWEQPQRPDKHSSSTCARRGPRLHANAVLQVYICSHVHRNNQTVLALVIWTAFQGQSTFYRELTGVTVTHTHTNKVTKKHEALIAVPVASLRIASSRVEHLFLRQCACVDLSAFLRLFRHINPRLSRCHCRENKQSEDQNMRKLCLVWTVASEIVGWKGTCLHLVHLYQIIYYLFSQQDQAWIQKKKNTEICYLNQTGTGSNQEELWK